MRKFRLQRSTSSSRSPMPTWGGDLTRHRLRQHLLLHQARPRSRPRPGTTCPPTSRTPSTSWASPRRSGSSWPASARSTSPRSSTTSMREDLEKQGVIFLDMDSGLREHPDIVKQYFGTVIPPDDNKFAALNSAVWSGGSLHLRAEGRQGRDPAAGLLPHQRGEHGPVRADADHRRRGRLRPLRRGLHGADLLDATRCTARWSRSSSRRARAAATRRSRTGRTTSTTWSPSAPWPTRTPRWNGSTATSARS